MNFARWLILISVVAAAPAASTAAETRLQLAVSRCVKLAELISCDAALSMKPNDPGLLTAEGDALVQAKRPGEAIGVYRNALRSGAGQEVVNPKIALAQGQRLALLAECETSTGTAAEKACVSAWLPGAPDEVMVFKRRGLLLQQEDQPAAALEAYMAAARLAPRDREVARAIVALSGALAQPDAPTWTARGAALLLLERPAEAIAALREALRLAPELAAAKARLRSAESTLVSRRRSPAATAAPPMTPRDAAAPADGVFSNDAPVTRSN